MTRIIDLSMPISEELTRWPIEFIRQHPAHCYQSSVVKMSVHATTHLDAPLHFVENGTAIDEIPLDMVIGEAALVDLTYKSENQGITPDDLQKNGGHIQKEDFVLLRTDWIDRMWGRPAFWPKAPYLTKAGAEWLSERHPKAVGCDFPQDYVIRDLLSREPDRSEFVVHHVFMQKGIMNIEYMMNLKSIVGKRCRFMALPLKLKGLEGSPVRAVAIEE